MPSPMVNTPLGLVNTPGLGRSTSLSGVGTMHTPPASVGGEGGGTAVVVADGVGKVCLCRWGVCVSVECVWLFGLQAVSGKCCFW